MSPREGIASSTPAVSSQDRAAAVTGIRLRPVRQKRACGVPAWMGERVRRGVPMCIISSCSSDVCSVPRRRAPTISHFGIRRARKHKNVRENAIFPNAQSCPHKRQIQATTKNKQGLPDTSQPSPSLFLCFSVVGSQSQHGATPQPQSFGPLIGSNVRRS